VGDGSEILEVWDKFSSVHTRIYDGIKERGTEDWMIFLSKARA